MFGYRLCRRRDLYSRGGLDVSEKGNGRGQGMDREKALEVALGQIEKQFGKGSIMRLGENQHMNVSMIPTGSLALDIALGIGGVPRGRVIEIFGAESSGKTTLALHILAETQR